MGTFLSTPATDVAIEEGRNELGVSFAVAAMQGWRSGELLLTLSTMLATT